MNRPPQPVKAPDFFGCLSFADNEIGRVIDAIDRFSHDALVTYTADHGDFLESRRLGSGKGPCMYEEITRIPFLVRWPGHAAANAVCAHPVSHIDVSGTLMEYFGHEVPKTLEGGSMLATFENPARRPRDEIFIE